MDAATAMPITTTGTIYEKLTMNTEIIKEIDVQNIMTKSALPVGGCLLYTSDAADDIALV